MTFVKKKRQSSVKLILWRKKSYFKGKKRLEARKHTIDYCSCVAILVQLTSQFIYAGQNDRIDYFKGENI